MSSCLNLKQSYKIKLALGTREYQLNLFFSKKHTYLKQISSLLLLHNFIAKKTLIECDRANSRDSLSYILNLDKERERDIRERK